MNNEMRDQINKFKTFLSEGSELKETYLKKKGKQRVSSFLHRMVDKYIDSLDEMSENEGNDFFVKDFYNWFKDQK